MLKGMLINANPAQKKPKKKVKLSVFDYDCEGVFLTVGGREERKRLKICPILEIMKWRYKSGSLLSLIFKA
jgi:hypothetical protein